MCPGSGPTDPDTQTRLEAVIAALLADTDPGVGVGAGTARLLMASTPVHGGVSIGGVTHYLYEINGWAYLAVEAA